MASFKKIRDGVWRARYRDPDGKEHARHFHSESAARDFVAEIHVSLKRGTYVDPKAGRTTVAEFFEEWAARQLWAHGTDKAMRLAMKHCTFQHVELGKVRRSHVETWVKQMTVKPLAVGTIKTRFNNVHAVMRGAVRDRMLVVDPMDGVQLPRARKLEHTMSLPSPAELHTLLESVDERLQVMVELCAFAGLRLGEAIAVQAGDFDFLRRTLFVQRQVIHRRGHAGEITPPKYGSERLVFVPDALLHRISQRISETGTHGPQAWLFAGRYDLPPHPGTMSRLWRDAVEAAGLPPYHVHDLRHFYASGLIAAGCDVVTVQRALGHAKPTTTLNTYAHLWPTAEDRTRKAAAGLVESVTGAFADSTADSSSA